MTVEVKCEETQISETVVSQEEVVEESQKVVVDGEVEVECKPKAVEKSSSYKEESNFPSDLKEFEKKALSELKAKLEEAILGNNLFKKEELDKKAVTAEEESEKPAEEEVVEEKASEQVVSTEETVAEVVEVVDRDVSLWGVPLLPSKGAEGTDVVLLKFLRARDFKVLDALEMLKKTLQWRKDSKIDSILDEELGADLGPVAYMNGVDREGHPVCYNIYGVFDNEELYQKSFGTDEKREEFLRWRFQLMEKGIQKLDLRPAGVSSLLQINDLNNSPGPSKKELRIATKQAVSLLQDNYPEFVARNIFINAPFWYYAFNALLSPFLTQRTKSKFVIARPAKVTETLLKYIPAEEIPIQYGGFKRENDSEFGGEDGVVSELNMKGGSTESIEIPVAEVGATLVWDLTVLGWEVSYKEEFVPADEGSYTIIVQKGKKMGSQEGTIRNTFRSNEPGKLVLTIENGSSKKKRVLYRHTTKKTSSS